MFSYRLALNFVKQPQLTQNISAAFVNTSFLGCGSTNLSALPTIVNASFFHTDSCKYGFEKKGGSRHGGRSGGRLYYNIMRERPLGPHKKLAPNVKLDGRMGAMENYRFEVHWPEDGIYTIKKLPLTKMGGRDPITGRKIIGRWGGGSKWKYRWIDWQRLPDDWPRDGEDLVEKVISINYDPTRKPMIALTGYKDKLRWQIATEGMKEGDLITTTWKIPKIPVKPIEGNSYPLGALPTGTQVCLVQKYHDKRPDETKAIIKPEMYFYNESTYGLIKNKVGDRVVVENTDKMQYSFDQRCQCVVGKVSIHPLKAMHIGSPNRMRWLGIRPRSGLWHRKTGRFGRKIRALPPVKMVIREEPSKDKTIVLNCPNEGSKGRIAQRKKDFPVEYW